MFFPSGFVAWLSSYLSDREQCVRIHGERSDFLSMSSGAPQGSLLGPYLFLLMCHDIKPKYDTTFMIQYADDITHSCPLNRNATNTETVNEEFHHLQSWSQENGFMLNSSKTQQIIIAKKSYVHQPPPFKTDDTLKILGVTWSSNLSWIEHFYIIESKCSKRLYMLRVLMACLSHDKLWTVYNLLIESLMLFSIELFGTLS